MRHFSETFPWDILMQYFVRYFPWDIFWDTLMRHFNQSVLLPYLHPDPNRLPAGSGCFSNVCVWISLPTRHLQHAPVMCLSQSLPYYSLCHCKTLLKLSSVGPAPRQSCRTPAPPSLSNWSALSESLWSRTLGLGGFISSSGSLIFRFLGEKWLPYGLLTLLKKKKSRIRVVLQVWCVLLLL